MANKKSKGSKPKGPAANSKPKESKPVNKRPASLVNLQGVTQLTPQERVDRVKPYWEVQPQEQRIQLLTLTLDNLRERAATHTQSQNELPPDPHSPTVNFSEVLEEGILRLRERTTWKIWSWRDKDGGTREFYDMESFKQFYHERLLADSLEKLLPKEEGKAVEKPAEAAFRERMQALLLKLQNPQGAAVVQRVPEEPIYRGRRQRAAGNELLAHSSGVRDTNIETITMILEAFEKEHEFLYNSLLHPITAMVCEVVPDEVRETNTTELYFEDLERMHPDIVARICEWLTEKVDTLSSKLKPEPKDEEEEEEENLGDVDLFALANDGADLTVNSKWLQHLSERLLGEDGVPRRVKLGEDPHNMGLVLEWVYGSIVSTAEKARDAAKRSLSRNPPSAQQAFQTLQNALQEQETWENRVTQARELLNEMLRSRKEAADLALQYDMRPRTSVDDGLLVDEKQLPNAVIVVMLRREVLLTRAKLFALFHERIMAEKQLRTLKLQLRQGEPEFERLKREMEENRLHHRSGLDSHGRSAADVERHRQQLADSALEEQLELQSAFRETSSRLQGIYDQRHRTEMELQKRETEIKQLQGWRVTVDNLVDKFEEQMAMLRGGSGHGDVEEGGQIANFNDLATDNSRFALGLQPANQINQIDRQASIQLGKLRTHFLKDVRKQLYNDEDDKHFFNWVQSQMKGIEKRLEEGRVALQHLELHLVNVACDDPGTSIGAHLALPMLQERLDGMAMEFLAERAKQAESLLYAMEQEEEARKLAESAKKQAAKQQKAQKSKSEKEKQQADRLAKEEAEREKRAEEARRRLESEEEERRVRAEQLEAARKAEEDAIEKRRQELLSDSNSYWSRRMAEQKAAEALLQDGLASSPEDEEESEESKAADGEDTSVTTETPSVHARSASATRSASMDDDEGFVTESRRRRPVERPRVPPNGRWPREDGPGPHAPGPHGPHASGDGFNRGPYANGFVKGQPDGEHGHRRGNGTVGREGSQQRQGRERDRERDGAAPNARRYPRDQQEAPHGQRRAGPEGSASGSQPPAPRDGPARPAEKGAPEQAAAAGTVQAEAKNTDPSRPSFAAVAAKKDGAVQATAASEGSAAGKASTSEAPDKAPSSPSGASDSAEPRDQRPMEGEVQPSAPAPQAAQPAQGTQAPAAAAPAAAAAAAGRTEQRALPAQAQERASATSGPPASDARPHTPGPPAGQMLVPRSMPEPAAGMPPQQLMPPPPPPPQAQLHMREGGPHEMLHPAMLHPPNALMLGHPQLPIPPPNVAPPPNAGMMIPPPPPVTMVSPSMHIAAMARPHFPVPPPPQLPRPPHLGNTPNFVVPQGVMAPQVHHVVVPHPTLPPPQQGPQGGSPSAGPPHPAAGHPAHGMVPQQLMAQQAMAMAAGHPTANAAGPMPMLASIPAPNAGMPQQRMHGGQHPGQPVMVVPPPPPPPQYVGVGGPPPPPRVPGNMYMYPGSAYPGANHPNQGMMQGPHVPSHAGMMPQQPYGNRMQAQPAGQSQMHMRDGQGSSSTRGVQGAHMHGMPPKDTHHNTNTRGPAASTSQAGAQGADGQPPTSRSSGQQSSSTSREAQALLATPPPPPPAEPNGSAAKDGDASSQRSKPTSTLRATAQPFVPSKFMSAAPAPVPVIPQPQQQPQLTPAQQRNWELLEMQQMQQMQQMPQHMVKPALLYPAVDQPQPERFPQRQQQQQQQQQPRNKERRGTRERSLQQQQQQAWVENPPRILQREERQQQPGATPPVRQQMAKQPAEQASEQAVDQAAALAASAAVAPSTPLPVQSRPTAVHAHGHAAARQSPAEAREVAVTSNIALGASTAPSTPAEASTAPPTPVEASAPTAAAQAPITQAASDEPASVSAPAAPSKEEAQATAPQQASPAPDLQTVAPSEATSSATTDTEPPVPLPAAEPPTRASAASEPAASTCEPGAGAATPSQRGAAPEEPQQQAEAAPAPVVAVPAPAPAPAPATAPSARPPSREGAAVQPPRATASQDPVPAQASSEQPAARAASVPAAAATASPAASARVMSWSAVAGRESAAAAAASTSTGAAAGGHGNSTSPSTSTMQRPCNSQQDSWRQKLSGHSGGSPASSNGTQQQQQQQQPAGAIGKGLVRQPSDQRLNTADGGSKPKQQRTGSGSGTARARSPPEEQSSGGSPAGPARTLRIGGVQLEGLDDSVRRLKLVRGLVNDDGQYNCFLNVTIQSLWHLRCFREGILRLIPADILGAGGPDSDVRVMQALWRIFKAMSMEPTADEDASPAAPGAAAAGSTAAPTMNGGGGSTAAASLVKGWTVNPWQLREALSGLDGSQSTVRIQLSEMHDASEVLGEIFNCLHRAELGRALEGQTDVQLPQRVVVRKDGLTPPASGNGQLTMAQKVAASHSNGGSVPNGNSSSSLATGAAKRSMVHKLFGLDVQVPCPPSSDEDEEEKQGSKQARRAAKAAALLAATAPPADEAAKKAPKKPKDPSMMDVEHFMKYFHLVPAQGLRLAYDVLFDGRFEDVLCEAETADSLAERARSGAAVQPVQRITLLRRPRVFTLAVVWESPQAPVDAIKHTTEALAPEVDLQRVFSGVPHSCKYRLRSVVCYFGHHYQSFALSEELQRWLLFDDTTIKMVGEWRDVVRTMQQQRLQPSLLFYEE